MAQLLESVQTFPLTYQTPLVRLSLKLTEKLRYNVGYQYYGYHEEFGLLSTNQSYRAGTAIQACSGLLNALPGFCSPRYRKSARQRRVS